MVAMVITLIGLLGLLQSVNVATEHNLKNHLRDEAVQIAETALNGMMVKPFDASFTEYTTYTSKIRSGTGQYTVRRTPSNMTGDARLYTVRVSWTHKNSPFSHEVQTVKAR